MSFARVFALAGRILAQFRHDPRTLGLMFVVPILVMALIGYVFRAQENTPVAIAVVSEDTPSGERASLAELVIGALETEKGARVRRMGREEADRAVRGGAVDAAILFGASFTDDLLQQRSAPLTLRVEGSNPAIAGPALGAVTQMVMRHVPALLRGMVPRALSFLFARGLPLEVRVERVYGSERFTALDYFAPLSIAFLTFFLVFLLTSVSFLRERTHGTMERLAASPVGRLEIVLGYMLGFGLFALLQVAVLVAFTVYALGVRVMGSMAAVVLVTGLVVLGAVNLGILLSAFARNELQAIQFIPIVTIPQFVLSGLFWPLASMPPWLQVAARFMPLTWANEALVDIMVRGRNAAASWQALAVLAAFAVAAGGFAAWSIRREVA